MQEYVQVKEAHEKRRSCTEHLDCVQQLLWPTKLSRQMTGWSWRSTTRVQDSGWLRGDLSKQFPSALLFRARRRDNSVTAVSMGTPNSCGGSLSLESGAFKLSLMKLVNPQPCRVGRWTEEWSGFLIPSGYYIIWQKERGTEQLWGREPMVKLDDCGLALSKRGNEEEIKQARFDARGSWCRIQCNFETPSD